MKTSHIKEEIKLLVDDSDKYSAKSVQVNILKARVNLALDEMQQDRDIVSKISKCLYKEPVIEEYHKFDDDLYIVKTTEEDYWYTVNLTKGSRVTYQVSYSYEAQLLITFGVKYDGSNSQFSDFASRMLGETYLSNQEKLYNKFN